MFKKSLFSLLVILCCNIYGQNELAIGEEFLKNGEIQNAQKILEKRIKIDPNDWKAMAYLGEIAGFKKNWDKAIDYYKVVVANNPSNAEYNFKYGGAMAMKVLEVSKLKALIYIPDLKKHLEKAAQLDINHVRSRRALVELYMELPSMLGGSEAKATKYANELKQIDLLEAALAHAFIYKKSRNEKQAALNFKQALSLSDHIKSVKGKNYLNYELGKIFVENDIDANPQQSLSLLDAFIKNHNYRDIHALEWGHYRKAQIHMKMKNKNEAKKSIEKALSIRPRFEEARLEKIKIDKL